MNSPALRWSLLAGVAYFCAMALAHFFGLKQPMLFVYYDTPYYAYQDKIISFAVLAYAGLFFAAAKDRSVVPIALTVLCLTVMGLSFVNSSSDLKAVLKEGQTTAPYWIQTGLFSLYFALLVVLHAKSKPSEDSASSESPS